MGALGLLRFTTSAGGFLVSLNDPWQLKPIKLTCYQNTTSLSVFVRVQ